MEAGWFLILLAFGAGFGAVAWASWWFSAEQRARRAMRSAAPRRIEDVLEGEIARVIGRAEPHSAGVLRAPLSGRACLCWRVVVEEYRRSGKSGRYHTIVDEHEARDFLVRDESGKALVKAHFVQPLLQRDQQLSSGFLNDATPELEAFLSERGLKSTGWVFNKSMRYFEGVLEPGEPVAVVGVGRWERDPEEPARAGAGYRDAQAPKRLVVESPASGPILLSDEPELLR